MRVQRSTPTCEGRPSTFTLTMLQLLVLNSLVAFIPNMRALPPTRPSTLGVASFL